MIQRIQTVYWLASAILLGIFISLPLFEFSESGNATVIHSSDVNFIYGPTIGQIIWILLAIFLFRRRSLQITIGYLALINSIAVGFCVFIEYKALMEAHLELKVLPWGFILILPIIFQILAIRAVKKDEALIKSMDRLR